MTNGRLVLGAAVGLSVLAGAIWLITELGWIGAVLVLSGVGVGIVGVRTITGRHVTGAAGQDELSCSLSTYGLPSQRENIFFELSASVHWNPTGPAEGQEEVARQVIVSRAREVTAGWKPEQVSLAQQELAALFATPLRDPADQLGVWATDVRLELSDADREVLAETAKADREAAAWEAGMANERRARAYLREDALKTPDAAIVWWLARNQGAVEKAVDLADVLTQLSNLATGRARADDDSPDARRLIAAISQLDAATRRRTADEFADALEQIGLTAEAAALRRKFQVQPLNQVVEITSLSTASDSVGSTDSGVER